MFWKCAQPRSTYCLFFSRLVHFQCWPLPLIYAVMCISYLPGEGRYSATTSRRHGWLSEDRLPRMALPLSGLEPFRGALVPCLHVGTCNFKSSESLHDLMKPCNDTSPYYPFISYSVSDILWHRRWAWETKTLKIWHPQCSAKHPIPAKGSIDLITVTLENKLLCSQ